MDRVNHPKAVSTLFAAFAAFSLIVLPATGLPPGNLPPVPSTVESITPAELRMHLEFLASDELGGRYTLAPNFAISARYLASHLKAYGFRGGAANGGYLQSFDVVSTKTDPAKTSLSLTIHGQKTTFGFDEIFVQALVEGTADGQIAFAGYGISSPAQKHDDYAGLDVKGKIVLLAQGIPEGIDRSKLGENEQDAGAAKAHGAAGILVIPSRRFSDFLRDPNNRERLSRREIVRLAAPSGQNLPAVALGPDLAEKALASLGLDLSAIQDSMQKHAQLTPKMLDASAHIAIAVQQTHTNTQNVVGILEGADSQLKDQYVVLSAHYDHLQTSPKGEIFHGADDDGSGTTAVLSLAHAFSLNHPKRSIMVIFHAGEELGLLGSEYNTDVAPAVPLGNLLVDLNIDMIGRSKPAGDTAKEDEHLTDANTVYLVGSNRISKELHKLSEETNSDYQKLKLDYYYNDPANPENIYYRSDHWNYAKHNITVIFYFDGTHVDYHRPSDTVDKIDFEKLTKITRLVFETGWRIANLDHRLSKDN